MKPAFVSRNDTCRHGRPGQAGVMLIETMIAILIFSLGVLSIVKLQAESVKQSSGAEYRSAAALLANDLVSRMWSSDRAPTALQSKFATDKDGFVEWAKTLSPQLPNANEKNMKTEPLVEINDVSGVAQVKIVLRWSPPGEKDDKGNPKVHAYTTMAYLR